MPELRAKANLVTISTVARACSEAIAALESKQALPRAAAFPDPPTSTLPRPAASVAPDPTKLPRPAVRAEGEPQQ